MFNAKDSKPIEHEDTNTVVPWKVYEKSMVMNEVREKRKDIIIIVLIILLFLSNAIWVYYWNQYEWVSDDYSMDISATQEGDGVNIVGGGDIDYGTEGKYQDTQKGSNEKTD